jgi:NADH oxidase (H2O2-forming)
MSKIVIIGNGISGVTAARHIRKNSDNEILLISGESEHFYSRTALMYIYMGHMRYQDVKPYEDWFWKKNKIDLMFDFVSEIDTDQKQLKMKTGGTVDYDKLIIAVGSKSNKFGWPGQDLNGVQGLYNLQDLEKLEKNSKGAKHAVIVGGGLIGVELAEMMRTRKIDVSFLVREDRFWGNVLPHGEGELVARHIREHHVDLKMGVELVKIIDDGNGNVKAVETSTGEVIECQIVGLAVGVSPNIEFLKSSKIELGRGVLVNEFLETNIEDVYALGDCAESSNPVEGRRSNEQVWYTGRIMGETLAQTICGNRMAYQPGPWFNSAKFFDIEFQTYGWVHHTNHDHETAFYWEHPSGKMCLHLVWDTETQVFRGVNTFGIRMRHDVFDSWLRAGASIDEVLSNLKSANFDPEFYAHHEEEIVHKFNEETGRNIVLKPNSWWRNLIKN